MDWVSRIGERWPDIAIPIAVFVSFLLLAMWVRRVAYGALERWGKSNPWLGYELVISSSYGPSLVLGLTLGLLLALEVSPLAPAGKSLAARGLWSVLILVMARAALGLSRGLIQLYLGRLKLPISAIALFVNTASVALMLLFLLIGLDVWGVPTSPVLLLMGVAAGAGFLAFRDSLASFFATWQLTSSGQIKVGDYIKLESGEEGYVTGISWKNTQLEALDATTILIPNSRLTQSRVVNYGHPLKKAREPFHFYTRLLLKELTAGKGRNLGELLDGLRQAPDAVIYYHTHHFVEEHLFLTPEPPNDFAGWVEDALGDEVLGERLASVDTFEFPSLGALRERLVGVIEEHLARNPNSREAPPGWEFHFIRSVSAILPLPYIAHDLREFLEVLRKVSRGSLYFHIFESRLRLGRGQNDFSIWIEDSLGDAELANSIARLDPYNYTLEGLRSLLVQLIEKRIK